MSDLRFHLTHRKAAFHFWINICTYISNEMINILSKTVSLCFLSDFDLQLKTVKLIVWSNLLIKTESFGYSRLCVVEFVCRKNRNCGFVENVGKAAEGRTKG